MGHDSEAACAPIRVAIVDDEALVRSGFELILGAAPDVDVVGTASGGGAIDLIVEQSPDVVLLDIRMPDIDGLAVLRQVRALAEPPVVAMLTTFDTDEYIIRALRSGAAGFLLKDTEPDQLAQSVRTLVAGGVVISPKAATTLVHPDSVLGSMAASEGEVARVNNLSEREREVLVQLAAGLSNAEIGRRIYLSAGTVKDHVSAILTKLRVGSRVQAALVAQRAGLLAAPRENS